MWPFQYEVSYYFVGDSIVFQIAQNLFKQVNENLTMIRHAAFFVKTVTTANNAHSILLKMTCIGHEQRKLCE